MRLALGVAWLLSLALPLSAAAEAWHPLGPLTSYADGNMAFLLPAEWSASLQPGGVIQIATAKASDGEPRELLLLSTRYAPDETSPDAPDLVQQAEEELISNIPSLKRKSGPERVSPGGREAALILWEAAGPVATNQARLYQWLDDGRAWRLLAIGEEGRVRSLAPDLRRIVATAGVHAPRAVPLPHEAPPMSGDDPQTGAFANDQVHLTLAKEHGILKGSLWRLGNAYSLRLSESAEGFAAMLRDDSLTPVAEWPLQVRFVKDGAILDVSGEKHELKRAQPKE